MQKDEINPLLNEPPSTDPEHIAYQKQMPKKMCDQGRAILKQQKYLQASKSFSKAIIAFEFLLKNSLIDQQQTYSLMKQTILPSYSNLSLCYLRLKNYQSVLKLTDQILQNDKSNVKARYRRGIAHQNLKNYDEAIQDFQFVRKQDSEMQQQIKQLISQCKRLKMQQKEKQRRIARQMIQSKDEKQKNNKQKDEENENLLQYKKLNKQQQKSLLKKALDCLKSLFKKSNSKKM